MAKYDVTHTCGHTEAYQLYGKHTERDRRIAWLETRPCTACHRDRLAAAASQAADQIRASGAVEGLPVLEGTERQANWAETIRLEVMERMNAELTEVAERVERAREAGNPEIESIEDRAAAVNARWIEAARNPSARWWIDTGRSLSVSDLLREIQAEAEGRIARDRARTEEERAREEAIERRKELEAKVAALCDRWHAIWGRPRTGEGADSTYRVEMWDRGTDRRIYIASRDASFGNNIVEYYHTGSGRHKSGSLVMKDATLADAAARRGVDADAIRAEIREFCVELCGWKCLRIADTRIGW